MMNESMGCSRCLVCRIKIDKKRKYTCVRCQRGIESFNTPIRRSIGMGVCNFCKKFKEVFDANEMKSWKHIRVCSNCIIKEGNK